MSSLENQPIHFLLNTPKEWVNHNLPKIREINSASLSSEIEGKQEERWIKTTEENPSDSHFSIIIPIRNEAEFLSSTLGSILMSDIPRKSRVTISLVTNNCTDNDKTKNEINKFMSRISDESIEQYQLKGDFQDPHIKRNAAKTTLPSSNISFHHIDTDTPGKANALTIGNTIARDIEDRVVICLDANTFPDIETIPQLYKTAKKNIVDGKSSHKKPAIISGNFTDVYHGQRMNGLSPRELLPSYFPQTKPIVVTGAAMAWDSEFIHSIGGIPATKMEDFSIGVITEYMGGEVVKLDAKTWRISPTTLKDRIDQLIRYRIGALQLITLFPDVKNLVESKMFFMKDWNEMEIILEEHIMNNSLEAYRSIITRAWKEIITESNKEFAQNPTDHHWDGIKGTK